MPLELRADFLFGFYQGHARSGMLEDVPSLERLHEALFAGACSLERQEGKRPSEKIDAIDEELFSWFETHAPDAINLPTTIVQESDAEAYRNKGEIEKKSDARKKKCVASARSFLSGPISWYWLESPSGALVQRFEDIVQEVPYLGESESRVVLSIVQVPEIPETAMRECAPSFNVRSFRAADEGFTNELVQFFNLRQKTVAREKTNINEKENSLQFNFVNVRDVYYSDSLEEPAAPGIPWFHGYALRVEGRRINQEDYVELCVAFHRALVSKFGDALPKVLQRASLLPLANGLGVQIISADVPRNLLTSEDNCDHILAMIPEGTPARDEAQIVRNMSQISSLHGRNVGQMAVSFTGEQLDLNEFWDPVPEGFKRLFSTEPLFIPDSRPPSRSKHDGSAWTVDDDARIAFGHVWRDLGFEVDSTGDQGRIDLSNAVANNGIAVGGGRVVPIGNIRSYVHHTNRGSLLVGERAMVDMGVLGHDRCLCAIGQTRHVGGGLLVPIDIPNLSAASKEGGCDGN